jgi:hypothetical protein
MVFYGPDPAVNDLDIFYGTMKRRGGILNISLAYKDIHAKGIPRR